MVVQKKRAEGPLDKNPSAQHSYHQWKRVPNFHEKVTSWSSFDEAIADAIDEFEERFRPLAPAERQSLEDPVARQRLRKNAGVLALSKPGDEAEAALASRAVIRKPKKSFVIGSMPLIKLTRPGRTHLGDPAVEVWFPISHDVAVSSWGSAGAEMLAAISDDHVRALNETRPDKAQGLLVGPLSLSNRYRAHIAHSLGATILSGNMLDRCIRGRILL